MNIYALFFLSFNPGTGYAYGMTKELKYQYEAKQLEFLVKETINRLKQRRSPELLAAWLEYSLSAIQVTSTMHDRNNIDPGDNKR